MMLNLQRRGSVLMEFLMVCPILLMLVSMLLQFSQIWIAREVTSYAAYCAARAALVSSDEDAPRKAAERVCAWISLANLERYTLGEGREELERLHDRIDVDTSASIVADDGDRQDGELEVPGWGWIPGSSSVKVRVKTVDVTWESNYVQAKVEFTFPMLFPMAGRIISWGANDSSREIIAEGAGSGKTDWRGEEYVMDESGELVEREGAAWAEDHRFPGIVLKEICILPKSYSYAEGCGI